MREKLIAGTAALTWPTRPGASQAWSPGRSISCSPAVCSPSLLALWPVPGAASRARRAGRIPRILRCPQFYAVLAFLGYLALAACNPAWKIASDDRGWWLSPIDPPLADWLPTSVQSHYEPMNAWRIFNMHLAAFSLALGLKLGLKRRGSLLFVLWAFLASSVFMAGVAIFQKYSGAGQVLWTYDSENRHFWGSFLLPESGRRLSQLESRHCRGSLFLPRDALPSRRPLGRPALSSPFV